MQKNSKVDIRKEEVCSKSVTKTFYESKFLVREYIFTLVYHCEGSRWSEICCARDIAKKSWNRLELLVILKSSHPTCTVEKGVPKIFTNFTGKHQSWSERRDSGTGVFLWILRNLKEHLFDSKPPVAASVNTSLNY